MTSESKKPHDRPALRLVVATMVATTTSIGCGRMHEASPVDAPSPTDAAVARADGSAADAGSLRDAGSSADASSPLDVALALDTSSPVDAFYAPDDADFSDSPDSPDSGYPDGIRG